MDIDSSGQYLVTTSTDNCVRFYDCMDAKLNTLTLQKHMLFNVKQIEKNNTMFKIWCK